MRSGRSLTDLPQAFADRAVARWSWLRRRVRASELVFILLAVAVGGAAGLLSVMQGALARTMQHQLFSLPDDGRLSGAPALHWIALLALPAGGGALALFSWAVSARRRRLVDAVEANALHGGLMSWRDSLVIAGQTIISNGFGASVGLEAAYAQLGGAAGSSAGRWFLLRRADLRNLVAAGAGAAIAAAFGAPLAGTFYAFEIVLGAYTPAAIAPVAGASLAGVLVAQAFGAQPYLIDASAGAHVETHHYLIYAGLGGIAAIVGIGMMRAVSQIDRLSMRLPGPAGLRQIVGGTLLIPLAMLTPQVLSAGHGALHLDLQLGVPIAFLAAIFLAKCAASIVSLGFGFRGGLFFASLFLGSLLGHMFADGFNMLLGYAVIDERNAALVGMTALAVAVVGGPFTMAMLVLEATHDFSVTGAVIAAALVSSTIVRETFGYSFSTWRLHLRGETIKSARDVGWMRSLTAGRMMRKVTNAAAETITIDEFRHRYPLGSTSRIVLVDAAGRYAGIVQTAAAYTEEVQLTADVATLAINRDIALPPDADVQTVMLAFDTANADELAVIGRNREVLGLLSESHVRRRYADELEKTQRDLFRE